MGKDSADIALNINSNLESTFKKANKEATITVDKINQINKKTADTNKNGDLLAKTFDKIKQAASAMLSVFTAGAGILGIMNLVHTVMDLDTASMKAQKTMGALGYSYKQMQNDVYALSISTGEAADSTMEIITNLANLRVARKDVVALASDVINFTRATGMGQEATSRLVGDLTTIGKLGRKQTEEVMFSMMASQKAYGLTTQQMEGMSDTIVRSTQKLQQLGRTAGQVTSFTAGVAKMSAAFASVGVSAETANKFVGDLLDPDRIEDNALLYSRLGISIQDAFTGNIDMDKSIDKFKALGQTMQNMNPAAAAAYAKSLGMSVGDLRAMADIDLGKYNKAIAGGADKALAMKIAGGQNLSTQEKISQTWNTIASTVMSLVSKFLPFLNMIVDALQPAITKLATDFNKYFTNGVFQNFVDGVVGFIQNIPKILSGIASFFNPAMLVAIGVGLLLVIAKTKKAFSKNIEEGVSQGIEAGFKKQEMISKMAKTTEKSLFSSGGAQFKIGNAAESMGVGASNRRGQILQDAEFRYQLERTKQENLNEQWQELEKQRLAAREGGEDTAESKAIFREQKRLADKMRDLEKFSAKTEEEEKKYYKSLTSKQKVAMLDQIQIEKASSAEREKSLNLQARREKDLKLLAEFEIDRLSKKERTYEEELALIKMKDEQKIFEEKIANLDKQVKSEEEAQKRLEKKHGSLSGGNMDATLADAVSPRTFAKAFSQAMNNASENIRSRFALLGNNINKSLRQAADSFKDGAKQAAKGMAGAAGKMALMALPMMLLGPLFSKLGPVITSLMDAIKPIFDLLIDALMPILQSMLHVLVPLVLLLLPPLLNILGFLLKAIGWLIKTLSFGNDAMQKVGESMVGAGDSMDKAADSVRAMKPDEILGKVDSAFESIKNNNSGTVVKDSSQPENGPVILQATGTGIRVMKSAHELQVEADAKAAAVADAKILEEAKKSRVAQEGILTLSQVQALANAKESADKKISVTASGMRGAKTSVTAEEAKAYGIVAEYDAAHKKYSFTGLPSTLSASMNAFGGLDLVHR